MGLVYMKQAQRAFTIIELVITVTILAILAATAVPSFRTLMANSRSTTLANEMFVALNIARSEAIKRGRLVSICPSSTGTDCSTTALWQDGWIVFLDSAGSDTASPVVGVGDVIKQWGANANGATVNVTKGAAGQSFIRFTGQGMLGRSSSDTNEVVIYVRQSGCQGSSARQLQIGIAGRVNQIAVGC